MQRSYRAKNEGFERSLIFIPGPAGNLETLITHPTETSRGIAIICHPHPLHGGTMHNKVITTIMRAFDDLHFKTVRFNFRGVQKSEGHFDEGRGEQEDLIAVIDWVKKNYPDDPITLAGFSFGAYISIEVAQKITIHSLISVAPPIRLINFTFTPEIHIPWTIIQGDQDEIINPQHVFDWIEQLTPKPKLLVMKEAGHFFHKRLLELRQILIDAVNS